MPCRDPRDDMSPSEVSLVNKRSDFRESATLLMELSNKLVENRKKHLLTQKIKAWHKEQLMQIGGIYQLERTINKVWHSELKIISLNLDNVTRMLCLLCKKLEKNNLKRFMSKQLLYWWKNHQKLDAKTKNT